MAHSANGSGNPSWGELLGSNSWSGLLQPLHPNLRALILQCGDMLQVLGDAFIREKNSKHLGEPRYGYKILFERVYFPYAAYYEIPDKECYINAVDTFLWYSEVHWMGYVAVSTDAYALTTGRREIYVAWRGTELLIELIKDLDIELVDPPVENSNSNGTYILYTPFV